MSLCLSLYEIVQRLEEKQIKVTFWEWYKNIRNVARCKFIDMKQKHRYWGGGCNILVLQVFKAYRETLVNYRKALEGIDIVILLFYAFSD